MVDANGDKAAEAVGLVPVVFVIGGPGCGKGTQCAMLVEKYGLAHLSTGDLLREEVASGSERGKELEEVMKEGKLVAQEVILELLEENIKKQTKMVLLDGFPRELEQAKTFEDKVCAPAHVLYFHCEEETMVARLLERAKTSGRADDNEETIKKRLHTFTTATAPVTECYREKGTLCQVDAQGAKEAIFASVEKGLGLCPKVCFVIGGPGSGKGTQCAMLAEKHGLAHFSSGDLLRAEVASGSDRGKQLEEVMKEGKLVDQDTVLELLKEAVVKSHAEYPDKLILLDGFPRELQQAQSFEEKICPASFVLSFDCSEKTMTERLLARAQTSGRADDNIETIKKRLVTFTESTKPVLDAYRAKGTLVSVSAEDAKETIFSNTCSGLSL